MMYRWSRDGKSLLEDPSDRLWIRGPVLGVSRADVSDAGTYKCAVANSEGLDSTSFTISVIQQLTARAHPQQQVRL